MSSLASIHNLNLDSPPPLRHSRWSLVKAWLPAFVWMAVIAIESTSIFTSDHTQVWLLHLLRPLFGSKVIVHLSLINAIGRKIGHFTGYAILSAFSFYGWTEFLAYRRGIYLEKIGQFVSVARRWHLRAAGLAVLTTFAVASLDEFHQAFIPGRTGVFHDVILDTLGGIFAQVLIMLFWKAGKRQQRKPTSEVALDTSALR